MINILEFRNLFFSHASSSHKRQLMVAPVSPVAYRIGVSLLVLNLILLLSFISGVNSNAATGYEIKSLQQKIEKLTEENQKMTVKVSEVSSISQLQSQLAGLDYVPVTGSTFLQVNQFSQR